VTRLNVSIREIRQYAKALFRKHAGERMLVVIRDRRSGRIRGVRADDGRVIYWPKHGLEGVIANVEVAIDHHVRVNVHVRP
jgi:hypothetical protein